MFLTVLSHLWLEGDNDVRELLHAIGSPVCEPVILNLPVEVPEMVPDYLQTKNDKKFYFCLICFHFTSCLQH